jgi:transcriptional regulator with XRE-family HTH domain
MSKKELARKAGSSPAVVTRWIGGGQNFTLSTLAKISAVFRLSLWLTNIRSGRRECFCRPPQTGEVRSFSHKGTSFLPQRYVLSPTKVRPFSQFAQSSLCHVFIPYPNNGFYKLVLDGLK